MKMDSKSLDMFIWRTSCMERVPEIIQKTRNAANYNDSHNRQKCSQSKKTTASKYDLISY